MVSFSAHNKSLLCLLAFTVVSSLIAYTLVVRAYDSVYEISANSLANSK